MTKIVPISKQLSNGHFKKYIMIIWISSILPGIISLNMDRSMTERGI